MRWFQVYDLAAACPEGRYARAPQVYRVYRVAGNFELPPPLFR